MLIKFRNLSGKYLRCIKEYGPIPEGTRAYCLHDIAPCDTNPEGLLRIFLEVPVLGVNEFKLTESAKENFKEL